MATKKNTSSKRTINKAAKSHTSPKVKGQNKKVKKNSDYYNIYLAGSLIMAVLLSIFIYIDLGNGGVINTAVRNLIYGLFGWTGYIVPVAFWGIFVYLIFNRNIPRMWLKFTQILLALSDFSAIIGLSAIYDNPSDAMYDGATNFRGGGYIGALLSGFSEHMVQVLLSYIIFIAALVVLIAFMTNIPLKQYIGLLMGIVTSKTNNRAARAKKKQKIRPTYKDKFDDDIDDDYELDDNYNEDIDDIDDDFFTSHSSRRNKAGSKNKQEPQRADIKNKSDNKTDIVNVNDTDDLFEDGIDDIFGEYDHIEVEDVPVVDKTVNTKSPQTVPKNEELPEKESVTEEIKPPKTTTKREAKERTEKLNEQEKRSFHETLDTALENSEHIHYVFPPSSLLVPPGKPQTDLRSEMRQTAERLIKVLNDFGVKAKLLQVTQGPAVTRYEIQPDTGTKLSKITGLSDDIAMNLAVSTALVAPVPGKVAVGIEIPNKNVSSVYLRELIESPEFNNAKSKLAVVIGKDIGGNIVIGDIAKWPHILIAGQTGSGKSVALNAMIISILYHASPEDVRMILIDPKMVEFPVYNGIPHLLIPVVTDAKKAAGALNWAVSEMMRRYELLKQAGVRKLENYNKLMESEGGEKLPQIVIIIDELADLMMVAAKEVEDYICRLAQLARAAGIHLVIAAQRPSVDVVTGLIKANIPSRMALNVASQVDSRTILDKGGAEKLLGHGDMLYFPTGSRGTMRLQGAFVSDEEIADIVDYIRESSGETHYSEDLETEIERHAIGENGVTPDTDDDGDPLLQDAIQLAVELGKISTSMVQRRLGVGYARAGRLVDQMEARGIISGANGSKPRDVLVSHADMAAAYSNAVSVEDYDNDDTE